MSHKTEHNRFTGKVVAGRKLGRELGFATANIALPNSEKVADGVYAGRVSVGGDTYGAMINIGHRPSVGGGERMLEAHLFDFHGDLYGRSVEVQLLEFVRGEEKFSSLEALKEAIESDRIEILEILKNHK